MYIKKYTRLMENPLKEKNLQNFLVNLSLSHI